MECLYLKYAKDEAIEELLQSIDRLGDFCVHDKLFAPMPRLEIDGVGALSFPVRESQLRDLIAAAERAPYGRGSDTLTDTSVRNSWQIDSKRIRLAGGAWPETFARILDAAAAGLGCPSERIVAQFYKMLVYERGGFFAPHRDTEKSEGMIATLTISLPVAGRGGDLVVRHSDRVITVDMRVEEPSELAYGAFYADCEHEVLPVAEGHRLSLVFNLCLRPGDESAPRQVPNYADQVDRIAKRLAERWRKKQAPDKLVWLLEHQYSESGLSFETLKNADSTRADALAAAAEQADCEIHAAVLHIKEEGYPTSYDQLYAMEMSRDFSEILDIGDVFDSRYWLDGWTNRHGVRSKLGKIPLEPGELLPAGELDDAEPDAQHLHEATGNAGVSVELAYRYAALALWPRSRTLAVIASGDLGKAISWLAKELDREDGEASVRVRRHAKKLANLWPKQLHTPDRKYRPRMFELLSAIGDWECTEHFLTKVMRRRYDGENTYILPAVLAIGPEAASRFLPGLVGKQFQHQPAEILDLLRSIGEGRSTGEDRDWTSVIRDVIRSLLLEISAQSSSPEKARSAQSPAGRRPPSGSHPITTALDEESRYGYAPRQAPLSDHAVRDLFLLSWRCGLADEAEAAAAALADQPRFATPDRAIPSALRELAGEEGLAGGAAYATMWNCAADILLERSATAPEEPPDWRISVRFDCNCEHCEKLRAFCENPEAIVERFKLREDLRKHLQEFISRRRLEIDCDTDRLRGTPYTLVCTKNRASHRRRLAEYSEDVSWMRELVRAAPGGAQAAACAPEVDRLRKAASAS